MASLEFLGATRTVAGSKFLIETSAGRSYLLSRPELAEWHRFGRERKEHVGSIAPILGTAVAWVVTRYGKSLAEGRQMRHLVIVLFVIAFAGLRWPGCWEPSSTRLHARAVAWITLAPVGLGVAGTFPPIFETFE